MMVTIMMIMITIFILISKTIVAFDIYIIVRQMTSNRQLISHCLPNTVPLQALLLLLILLQLLLSKVSKTLRGIDLQRRELR